MGMREKRENFEKWFSDDWRLPKAVFRSGDGYKLSSAQSAWIAWQAATIQAKYEEGVK